MNRLVACVPNFSEGRNGTVVRTLADAVDSTPGVFLLDQTMDADHHRSVLTFVGEPEAAQEAAFRAIRMARGLIDLRKHAGVHPRVGATDVVPFVPVRGVTMQDCVRLGTDLGRQVGQDLDIPVFLYERAATRPEHESLEAIRQGGLEGLAFRMGSDPHWLPDFGPPRPHPSAGVIVIGARPPLIAFNVNLQSQDVNVARSIAKTIRRSNGGVPCLKAIGVELASRKMVQVAMNLTDYRVTPLQVAFDAVQAQASLRDVSIAGSEIIGLVPEEAFVNLAADVLKIRRLDATQVLETRIEEALLSAKESSSAPESCQPEEWLHLSVPKLLAAVAAPASFPAGASVSALVGALAASLGIMAARVSRQRASERQLSKIMSRLCVLAPADGTAYQQYLQAAALSKSLPDRPSKVSAALHVATEIPLEIAEQSAAAGALVHAAARRVKPRLQADARAALSLAVAAGEASLHIAKENLKIQPNQRLKEAIHRRVDEVSMRLEELSRLCYTPPPILAPINVNDHSTQALPGKVQKRSGWKSKSSITTSRKRSRLRRKSSRAKGYSGN